MGRWSDDSAYWAVHNVRLYSVLDTVVISGDYVCCSVVLWHSGLLCVFSVMWSDFRMTSAISCLLWSSVYEFHKVECAFTFPVRDWVWYVSDVLYTEGNYSKVHVNCFVVRGCAISRRYINVFNHDVFSVFNMYLGHLKFCVVCINGRRYVCCSECMSVCSECMLSLISVMSPPLHYAAYRW